MSPPPPLPPSPLPYQAPPDHRGDAGGSSFDWNTFFRALLIVLVTIVIMRFVVPHFARTFADFKMELPATTKALMALEQTVAGGWWIALLAIPPGLGFLVAQFGPVGRRLARIVIVLAFGAFVGFVALGIFQPMLTLAEGINSNSKK